MQGSSRVPALALFWFKGSLLSTLLGVATLWGAIPTGRNVDSFLGYSSRPVMFLRAALFHRLPASKIRSTMKQGQILLAGNPRQRT